MKLDRIAVNDIVEVRVRGRLILGRVAEIKDGVVYFDPICPGAGLAARQSARGHRPLAQDRKTAGRRERNRTRAAS